jgi:hypothetical protein
MRVKIGLSCLRLLSARPVQYTDAVDIDDLSVAFPRWEKRGALLVSIAPAKLQVER